MLVDLTKKEIQMLIASLMNDANTSNGHSTLYDKLSTLEKVCTCRENITADNDTIIFDPWRTYPKADNVVYFGK